MKKLKLLNRKLLNKLGYELVKYNPRTSDEFRLKLILNNNNIDLVLDIGANIGGYAQMLRELNYKGKIISFEPLQKPYEILSEISEIDSEWEIAPRMAIGDENKLVKMNVSKNVHSSSILDIMPEHVNAAPDSKYLSKEEVVMKTLDDYFNSNAFELRKKNIFMKIDVQGFEENVLNGAEKTLNNIKMIQIELSLTALYEGQKDYFYFINFFKNLNYNLHAVFPGFSNNNTGKLLQMDCIFLKGESYD